MVCLCNPSCVFIPMYEESTIDPDGQETLLVLFSHYF